MRLTAVDAADDKVALSAAQLNQVRSIFPAGVCDFSKETAEQVPQADPWLSYPSPGTFQKTEH